MEEHSEKRGSVGGGKFHKGKLIDQKDLEGFL